VKPRSQADYAFKGEDRAENFGWACQPLVIGAGPIKIGPVISAKGVFRPNESAGRFDAIGSGRQTAIGGRKGLEFVINAPTFGNRIVIQR
jgi:hypothetical protein